MVPSAGERWWLRLRLRPPRGFSNPGGFDYEAWLLTHRLAATGYIRADGHNRRLTSAQIGLLKGREWLSHAIERALPGNDFAPIIQALGIGVRGELSASQWDVLRRTGTGHLMAISGLHIGLVAGGVYWLASLGWRRSGWLMQRWPAGRAAAVLALTAAAAYTAASGHAIPAQRALIMAGVVLLATLFDVRLSPTRALALALLGVLAFDPFAPLSAGFWLSFAAVGLILGYFGRAPTTHDKEPGRRKAWDAVKLQFLLSLGLAPLVWAMFHTQPAVAPLANLIAVPWVSLVVVPLVLMGLVSIMVSTVIGGFILSIAASALALLWPLLEFLAKPNLVLRAGGSPDWPALVCAAVGLALLLLPRGLTIRWLGVLWLLPVLLHQAPRPASGEVWITTLDVGQGLGMVVETSTHALVFDTGPRLGANLDGATIAINPYLSAGGYDSLDMVLLSHGHQDHTGGVSSLLEAWPRSPLLTNVALPVKNVSPCLSGRTWHWDGVDFRVLHPLDNAGTDGNDESCVLGIYAPGGSALLPADIERAAERSLMTTQRLSLRADVLIVPHHGSKTSSTAAFIEAVEPRIAIVSRGHLNRFGLPDETVKARYLARGVLWLDTAQDGAVQVRIHPKRGVEAPLRHRQHRPRFWHAGHDSGEDR